MNAKDFKNEMLQYVTALSDEFTNLQNVMWDLLEEFHEICMENAIPYQVAYGSLLGLYRDKGPIPWDYDIDVLVHYKDKDKLYSALSKGQGDRYIIDCVETDKMCDSYKIRLVPKGKDPMYQHIDIFFLIPAPVDDDEYKRLANKLITLSKIRRYKTGKANYYAKNTKRSKVEDFIHKIMYSMMPLERVDKQYYTTLDRYIYCETGYYMHTDRWAAHYKFPAKLIDDIEECCVQGRHLNAPKNIREMLTFCYGENLGYASVDRRFDEWYKSCKDLGLVDRVIEKD